MRKSTREIIGRMVITQDGRQLGTVEALQIALPEWQVRALQIRARRDALEALHLKRPLFGTRTITLSAEHVAGVTDAIVLKVDLRKLASLLGDAEHEEAG